MWLSLAAAAGQRDALVPRYKLSRDMTAEQIAAGRRLASTFVPRQVSRAVNQTDK